MKEKPEAFTDPILEEFYRYKTTYPTKLITLQELIDYLQSFQTQLDHPSENLFTLSHPTGRSNND